MTKLPFKFRFNTSGRYNYSELCNFIECAGNIEPVELRDAYVDFLNELLADNIKPSTLVRFDVMQLFVGDLDNRAQIDYREGHWNDEPSIVRGGKFFDKRAREMQTYLASVQSA
jgi:hypothetical protein